ncbi:DUF3325 domain-containing protein [Cupriavidus basilensis]|uniref:DUF3325 domain-containing protein n=1 Tax=Cupriavidus basilensis TaxID=68895 RepID=UPI0009E3DF01|nr:DUF3325 domain-containing protein [Cupriavidus basilensis]
MMWLSLTLALLGFAALALAMRSHHRELFGVDCSRRRGGFLRVAGVVSLFASYNGLRVVWGVVEGTIAWLCLASMAAIVIVFLLGIATSLLAPIPERWPSGLGGNVRRAHSCASPGRGDDAMRGIYAAITTAIASIDPSLPHKSNHSIGQVIAHASNHRPRGRSPMSRSRAIPSRLFL